MKVKVIQNTTSPIYKEANEMVGKTFEVELIVIGQFSFKLQDLQILPDDTEFTPGEEIEVSDNEKDWVKLKYVGKRIIGNDEYKYITDDELRGIDYWKHARKLKTKPKFTKAEVAAKLGVDDFEITD